MVVEGEVEAMQNDEFDEHLAGTPTLWLKKAQNLTFSGRICGALEMGINIIQSAHPTDFARPFAWSRLRSGLMSSREDSCTRF